MTLFLFDVNVIRDMEINIKEGFSKICQGVKYIFMILDVPIAGLIWCIKYGKANGKQTYKCKDCFHCFIPDSKRASYPDRVKKKAIRMYCEGMSIHNSKSELMLKASLALVYLYLGWI